MPVFTSYPRHSSICCIRVKAGGVGCLLFDYLFIIFCVLMLVAYFIEQLRMMFIMMITSCIDCGTHKVVLFGLLF